MKPYKFLPLVVFALLLTACSKSNESNTSSETSVAENRGAVLAEIGGEKIYEQELNTLLKNMFGEYQASKLDEEGRKKALQSLVASRALVKLAEKSLSQEALAENAIRVRQYRENTLINAYVKTQFKPQPVSNEMIEAYYQSHLENFGQKILPEYELISTKQALPPGVRDKFLDVFAKADKSKGLKHVHEEMQKQGFSLQYHKGVLADQVLNKKVSGLIRSQKLHQVSNITFIDDKPYVVLVIAEKKLSAKPLADVRMEIRKTLAMKQLKASVKTLSENAVKQFDVIYQQ